MNYPSSVILRDETLYETVSHGSGEYPFACYIENVWDYDLHCIDWHLHPEVEFVLVESGILSVSAGTEHFSVSAGQGVFVNSRTLHRFESEAPADIPNIVFSPALLAPEDSLIFRKYIEPILEASAAYQIFSPDIEWQNQILLCLKEIFEIQKKPERDELLTLRSLLAMWNILYQNTPLIPDRKGDTANAGKQAQLQIMMHFIQENFQKEITLEEIASSALISKSSALRLFQSYLNISPVAYLVRYRLQYAAKEISGTEKNISAISRLAGFNDSAYFCRKFKELYHKTPGQYRKKEAGSQFFTNYYNNEKKQV